MKYPNHVDCVRTSATAPAKPQVAKWSKILQLMTYINNKELGAIVTRAEKGKEANSRGKQRAVLSEQYVRTCIS